MLELLMVGHLWHSLGIGIFRSSPLASKVWQGLGTTVTERGSANCVLQAKTACVCMTHEL